MTKLGKRQRASEALLDEMADDGRLGIIAKRIAIESGVDWPSLDGEAQDAWHERAIEALRGPEARRYLADLDATRGRHG